MLPVEGYKGLYRDEESGAIINCNSDELTDFLKTKEIYETQKRELDSLRTDIEHIKSMLSILIESKA